MERNNMKDVHIFERLKHSIRKTPRMNHQRDYNDINCSTMEQMVLDYTESEKVENTWKY